MVHDQLTTMSLADEIRTIPISPSVATDEVAKQFLAKLDEGGYSRDENPMHHFGAYFLLYNPATKTVFITHHKKSGLWLFPGGHVDRGETTIQTLKREMHEELGVVYNPPADQKPFLLTITRMDAPNYRCKTHFDVWYKMPTDGSDFKIDPSEFHDTQWVSIDEARKLIVDEQNLQALAKIEGVLK
jgi:8-oxo-dGTP pyrophosphatase MutT (NUDIX family)